MNVFAIRFAMPMERVWQKERPSWREVFTGPDCPEFYERELQRQLEKLQHPQLEELRQMLEQGLGIELEVVGVTEPEC